MKNILKNRWFKFAVVTLIYVLWFVVWTESLWMLLGVPVIFDIYITKYLARLVRWDKHLELKKNNKTYKEIWSWVDAIVFALVFATLINTYFFQMYTIPTSSMEKTLLVGDYLYVSKSTYGPRLPNTPLSLPLMHHTTPWGTKSYSEAISRPYKRLAGMRDVERGDVVVFNFPAGDTVILERQNETYYDIVRQFTSAYGEARGRQLLEKQYNVVARPVDKREHYVKRCVALPGDTLHIEHGVLYVNGVEQNYIDDQQYIYFVQTSSPLSAKAIERLGVSPDDLHYSASSGIYAMPLTNKAVEMLEGMQNVVSVTRNESTETFSAIFPNDDSFTWTEDNFGPLWMPSKGATVELTTANLPIYERIIKNYEGYDLEVEGDDIFIDGEKTDKYTFAMDYYFMMGDNRHMSADSRFWGFVPEDHIVGTPSFVWLSLDKFKSFPSNIRWNRMFKNHK
ncbi:MAG: signal peptidase I [Tidjanibacter sp.]|nr:signal peptidase I [Tidjanibacter sp.]